MSRCAFSVFIITLSCPEPSSHPLEDEGSLALGSPRAREQGRRKTPPLVFLHLTWTEQERSPGLSLPYEVQGTLGFCLLSSPLDGLRLLSSADVATRPSGGTRRRQPLGVLGRRVALGSRTCCCLALVQTIPLSISASIICMTHLADAKKLKDFVFLPIKGEVNLKSCCRHTYQAIIRPKPKSRPEQAATPFRSMEWSSSARPYRRASLPNDVDSDSSVSRHRGPGPLQVHTVGPEPAT